MRWTVFLLVAGCATTRTGAAPVDVSVAPDPAGMRVWFRLGQKTKRRARLRSDGGSLDEVCISPDLRTVSVLWRDPSGELACTWPLAGVGQRAAKGSKDVEVVRYVLLEEEGVSVRMKLPRGCPMLPTLRLEVSLDKRHVPARLFLPGAEIALPHARSVARFPLPRDRHGVLRAGEYRVVVLTRSGREFWCLVGIDPDGTPTASTGYVRPSARG